MAAYEHLLAEKDELIENLKIKIANEALYPSSADKSEWMKEIDVGPQNPERGEPVFGEEEDGQLFFDFVKQLMINNPELAQNLQVGPGKPSSGWETLEPLPPIPNPAGEGWGEPAEPPGGHEKWELRPGWWKNKEISMGKKTPNQKAKSDVLDMIKKLTKEGKHLDAQALYIEQFGKV